MPKALPSGVSRLELLTSAVAEVLRFRSPVVTMPRVCREDRELGALLERASISNEYRGAERRVGCGVQPLSPVAAAGRRQDSTEITVVGFAALPVKSQDSINVILDGMPVAFDVPPTVIEGRTLVPLRKLFEALGATVEWDAASRRITAVRGSTRVELTLDNPTAMVNGKPVPMDVPPKVVDGRTMVPLRFVSEALGDAVTWDGANRAAVITRKSSPAELTAGDLALRPEDLPFPARVLKEGKTADGGYERLLIRGAPGERTGPEIRTHWIRVGPGMADLLPSLYCGKSDTPERSPALGDAAVACTRALGDGYTATFSSTKTTR